MTTAPAATHATAQTDRPLSTSGIWKGAAAGAAAAAVGNAILYFAASASGVSMVGEFVRGQAPVAMPFPPVIFSAIVPALGAAGLATLLNRWLARPATVFLWVSIAFGVFSMGGPVSIAGASTGLRLVLAVMHVVAGVAIAGGILRFGKR
jgi:hypothetical protein